MVMGLVSGLVCVSENNMSSRARFLGVPAGRTHVVNNGIDVALFDEGAAPASAQSLRAELGIEPGAPVVGTAIRFEPGKGVEDLVRSFALVRERHPSAVLLWAMDGYVHNSRRWRTNRVSPTQRGSWASRAIRGSSSC